MAEDWWKSYFSSLYGELYQGILRRYLDTTFEVGILERLFPETEKPVLDVGCGYGRHVAGASRRGVNVLGLEYSHDLIMQAAPRLRSRFVRASMASLPIRNGSLGGAWMLFNTFGYFDDAGNQQLLAELGRAIASGGLLLLDAPARAGMTATIAEGSTVRRRAGQAEVDEQWHVVEAGQRLEATGRWMVEGRSQTWRLSLRMYSPAEMRAMLRKAGFDEVRIVPLEDLERLAEGMDDEEFGKFSSTNDWNTATNMAVLARRT